MAVPSITSISPVAGHTGGRTFVEIDGANFAVPVALAPVNGIVPPERPAVAVTFGGVPALEVRCVSASLLYVVTPIHDPGAVDVVVQNLDANGNAIPGEAFTLASGFAYQLPNLTTESDLARLIRSFIQEAKRQIVPNVNWPSATDYDDTTGDGLSITKLAALPALIIAETEIDDNDFFAERGPVEVQKDADDFFEIAPPVTVDVLLTLAGVSDDPVELVNLLAATKRFFRKNPYLSMLRDPANPSAGSVRYEMDWKDHPEAKLTIAANKDNVRHFAGQVTIRGFDIEAMAGLPLGGPGIETTQDREAVTDIGQTAQSVVLEPSVKRQID